MLFIAIIVVVMFTLQVLDTTGRGYITIQDLVNRYDTSLHPEVASGRRTRESVLREFLDGFDGGQRDGKVTSQEFERYYATISASIDDDDYFELMIRNCWHISGGKGWTENTTNRRVLVVHRDGSQTVEEVPNDLVVGSAYAPWTCDVCRHFSRRPHPLPLVLFAESETTIKRALQAKGIDAVDVSLYGMSVSSIPSGASGMPTTFADDKPRRRLSGGPIQTMHAPPGHEEKELRTISGPLQKADAPGATDEEAVPPVGPRQIADLNPASPKPREIITRRRLSGVMATSMGSPNSLTAAGSTVVSTSPRAFGSPGPAYGSSPTGYRPGRRLIGPPLSSFSLG